MFSETELLIWLNTNFLLFRWKKIRPLFSQRAEGPPDKKVPRTKRVVLEWIIFFLFSHLQAHGKSHPPPPRKGGEAQLNLLKSCIALYVGYALSIRSPESRYSNLERTYDLFRLFVLKTWGKLRLAIAHRTSNTFLFFSIRRFYEQTSGIFLIWLVVTRSSPGVLPENACFKS